MALTMQHKLLADSDVFMQLQSIRMFPSACDLVSSGFLTTLAYCNEVYAAPSNPALKVRVFLESVVSLYREVGETESGTIL